MGDNTGIGWTDATWNPIVGCTVHTPGCTRCYAMKMAARLEAISVAHERDHAGDPGPFEHYRGITQNSKAGPVWNGEVREAPHAIWTKPLAWKRPRRIFVNSMSDLWHPAVPDSTIDRVFASIASAPHHTYQILTKRADRMHSYMTDPRTPFRIREWLGEDVPLMWPLPQVWLGVSAEDQHRADERLPYLLASPARIRWISLEPLIGGVDLRRIWLRRDGQLPTQLSNSLGDYIQPLTGNFTDSPKINWIVVGGESGRGARPIRLSWVRQVRDQCAEAGVAFDFKQWGEWAPAGQSVTAGHSIREFGYDEAERCRYHRVGKGAAGRLLDGVQHDGMPA